MENSTARKTTRKRPYTLRLPGRPVRFDEVTPAMLAPIQEAADRYKLPQTVWPSKFFGPDYQGEDCLLTSMAAPGLASWERPWYAAEGSEPFLTVLPAGWFR